MEMVQMSNRRPRKHTALYSEGVLPALTACFLFSSRCKFFSLTETPEDYTIIVDEEGFKGGSLLLSASLQSPWQLIRLRNLWFPPAPMFEHTLSLWFVVG